MLDDHVETVLEIKNKQAHYMKSIILRKPTSMRYYSKMIISVESFQYQINKLSNRKISDKLSNRKYLSIINWFKKKNKHFVQKIIK